MVRSSKKHTHITYYEGPETPKHEIRTLLLRSAGGQVDLVMNENTSIATLCLSHPEKRNAISGKRPTSSTLFNEVPIKLTASHISYIH